MGSSFALSWGRGTRPGRVHPAQTGMGVGKGGGEQLTADEAGVLDEWDDVAPRQVGGFCCRPSPQLAALPEAVVGGVGERNQEGSPSAVTPTGYARTQGSLYVRSMEVLHHCDDKTTTTSIHDLAHHGAAHNRKK